MDLLRSILMWSCVSLLGVAIVVMETTAFSMICDGFDWSDRLLGAVVSATGVLLSLALVYMCMKLLAG